MSPECHDCVTGSDPQGLALAPWYGSSRFMVVLIILATLAVYGRAIGHDFVTWDDYQHVLNNPRVNPPSWSGVGESWRHPYWGLYIPVSYTFFAAEAALALRLSPGPGAVLSPSVFHLGSLALHIGCVLMVFSILRRVLAQDGGEGPPGPAAGRSVQPAVRNGAACAGALLMGLHPAQVESVAWISETRGLLCALCSLVAIRLYLQCADRATSRRATMMHYGLASLALLLALLSKPAAVAVPLIAGGLDLGILRRSLRQVLALLGPWLLLVGAITLLTREQQPGTALDFVPTLGARLLVAGHAAMFYLGKLVVPWPLGPDYGCTPQSILERDWVAVAWIVPALFVVVLALLPGRRGWLIAAAVFFAWLTPVLGFVPFDFQRISTVADRYVYLAMLGPALALTWFLARHWNLRVLCPTAALLAVSGLLSFQQTSTWQDSSTLFAHALEVNPHSAVAQYHLGLALARAGSHAEAVALYRDALAERPDFAEIHDELGNSLFALGRKNEAAEKFRDALALAPDNVDAHLGLGASLEASGKVEEARSQYLAALGLWPESPRAHYYLGNLALKEPGNSDRAIAHYEAALHSNPAYAEAHVNLGIALWQQGRAGKALWHAEAATRLDPTLVPAWVLLGRVLAATGHRDEAAAAFHAALELTPPGSESARQIRQWLQPCQRSPN